MTTDNLFIPDNIPDSAKMLSSEKFTWLAYLLVVPILAIAYAGIVITDELKELEDIKNTDFTIMSPISYFGRQRRGQNARYLYALVFDLDGVYMPQLRDTLHQMNKDIIPKATFIVNSGTGLHLYYVLTEPVPMYPHNQKILKELKYSLTRQIWNRFTSSIKEPQMQGVLQGFRVVGSGSKLGRDYPVVAYPRRMRS